MNLISGVQQRHTIQHSLSLGLSLLHLKLQPRGRQAVQYISWSQGHSTSPLISESILQTSIPVWTAPDKHILCQNILEFDFILFNTFMNEVMLDVDVLSMWVIDWIVSEGNTTLIISVNNSNRYLQEVKFSQQSSKPDSLLHSIWRGHIFCFNRQSSNDRLLLRRSQNNTSSNFKYKASNGALIIQILSLIWVCSSNQIKDTLLWQPLDQCPITVQMVNLKDKYLVGMWVVYSQENSIGNYNSILPIIYISVLGLYYDFFMLILMSMPCPHVHYSSTICLS